MRKSYLDDSKGLAIILMVFGHTMVSHNFVHQWIFSFHMPMFFIVGGILIGSKEENKNWNSKSNSIKRRILTAGIPYLIFGLLLCVFYSVLNILGNEPVTFSALFWKLITLKGINALWFLPAYVLGSIAMILTSSTGWFKQFLFALICCAIVCIQELTGWPLLGEVVFKATLGICFFEVGVLIAHFNLFERLPIPMILLLFIAGLLMFPINGSVEMAPNQLGNPFVYMICASATSISLIGAFYRYSSIIDRLLPHLRVFGQYSMAVLCTQNILIESIRLLDYKLTGNFLVESGMTGSIIFTIALLFIELQIIRLAQGKFGWIFGYLPRKKQKTPMTAEKEILS